jgi:S-(hydroxymethyl)mycothiol dehydrogenase
VVSAVGPNVTEVAPGDRVILNWRAVCGECRACAKGQPQYCFNTHNATRHQSLRREDARRRRAVHKDRRRRSRRRRAARLRVMAGIGAAINTGEVKRGESVAGIGCIDVGIDGHTGESQTAAA